MCAIALGLGAPPSVLGRGNHEKDYIKIGTKEAGTHIAITHLILSHTNGHLRRSGLILSLVIEIELKARPHNCIIIHRISAIEVPFLSFSDEYLQRGVDVMWVFVVWDGVDMVWCGCGVVYECDVVCGWYS
mgnify:CR=1 FL=1